MTHEFSHDPIKVRIVDLYNKQTKHTYVFVGSVPKDVEKELQKLEKNLSTNNTILKKFYGANWHTVLGLSKISGGAEEYEIDDDLLNELNDLDLSNISTDTKKPDDASEVISDSVNTDSNLLEITESDVTKNADFLTGIEESLVIKHTGGIKFITNINITPVDDILEFKYKIYAAIGIPIYRQHLWFKYKHKSYPLNYVLSVHKQIENINIERLVTYYSNTSETNTDKIDSNVKNSVDDMESEHHHVESIEGIPIEVDYYNNKDFIHVVAKDNFDILRNIYYKYSNNEYLLVDLNDLINPNDLYNKLYKDKYQLELIYYGFIILYWPMITFAVFQDYLKNEKTIKEIYPELLPDKYTLNNHLKQELDITSTAYESLDDKNIDKNIFSSITSTTISINNYNQDIDVVISLRNLFDVLELNDTITYGKANLLHNNKNVILRKSYLNEREPKDDQPINSLLVKIKISADANENMRLIIFKNGNYIVNTDWREENNMNFNKITKLVSEKINPIIKIINKYGEKIKYHEVPIMEINKDNILFTETAMSFYYDDDVTEAKFTVFKNILSDFKRAGIIISKESVSSSLEYFFNKGMYKYDSNRIEKAIAVDNYYEFLSNGVVQQKWNTIFNRTRLFQIINISSKLKITISGIRDDVEMDIFLMYLKGLFYIYKQNTSHIKVVSSETTNAKSKKTLKNLKVLDPLLYDFKKIYKSNVIYSKICQKPYQPVILSDDEYSKLPKDKKEKALKYWNFTRQKPAWYSCPNVKYPYIKFIVKQHPKDFCIPCCKKIEMNESVNIKKQTSNRH